MDVSCNGFLLLCGKLLADWFVVKDKFVCTYINAISCRARVTIDIHWRGNFWISAIDAGRFGLQPVGGKELILGCARQITPQDEPTVVTALDRTPFISSRYASCRSIRKLGHFQRSF
mgnify:CR=1 FL=1